MSKVKRARAATFPVKPVGLKPHIRPLGPGYLCYFRDAEWLPIGAGRTPLKAYVSMCGKFLAYMDGGC